uniref:Uncharacterized protein n=1 Tax=Anguilla anguilla TaxID=7936 RepID=A0A0E9TIT6_ANGAN
MSSRQLKRLFNEQALSGVTGR